VAQIATALGVTDSSVLDRMRARDWTGPPQAADRPGTRHPHPRSKALRHPYVTEGLSVAEVAKRLGRSPRRP